MGKPSNKVLIAVLLPALVTIGGILVQDNHPKVINNELNVSDKMTLSSSTISDMHVRTTTLLFSSQNPSVKGQTITFVAIVRPSTNTGTVSFFDGDSLLAASKISGGAAVFTTRELQIGSHNITAFYTGDTNNTSSSFTLDQVVNVITPYPDSIKNTNTTSAVTLVHTINPQSTTSKKIAIIQPTFTEAAYNDAFYVFYNKYSSSTEYPTVRTDLNLLTSSLGAIATSSESDKKDMDNLQNRIMNISQNATITKLTDQDVEDGQILANGTKNAYDVLVLLHEEYVTQKIYDEYKRFVSAGGEMIFLDSNFFYAEVSYDKIKNTVTLVKGHGWSFNGTVAKRDVYERWSEDTKEWVGSNFLNIPASQKILFSNNVFDYKHHEENLVNNPNDLILTDYGAYASTPIDLGGKIASYELKYGQGKVVVIGLYGQDVLENSAFVLFFDSLIKDIFLNNLSSHAYQIPMSVNNSPSPSSSKTMVPSTPISLTAYATSKSSIVLSWEPPKNDGGSAIMGYKIEYDNGSGHYTALIENTKNSQTTYLDTDLISGITYTYRVSAINSIGVGNPSISASATTQDATYPRIITANVISPTEVSLSWIPPSQTYGQTIIGYKIDQIIGEMNISLVDNTESPKTSYVISNLTPGKKYILSVTAIFSEGNSISSPSISITTNAD